MKTKNRYNSAQVTIFALSCFRIAILVYILLLALSGCVGREDYSLCPRPFDVFIKVEDINGNDITERGDVKQLILFIFDENGKMIGAIEVTGAQVAGREPIKMAFDPRKHPKSITFDVWANTSDEVDFSAINTVQQRENLYLLLKKQTDGSVVSPGDIFHGSLVGVPIETGGIEAGTSHVVVIKRKVASVIITTTNLKPWYAAKTRATDDIYHYRVHGTSSGLDYKGILAREVAYHIPQAQFTENDHFVAPLFNVLPTPDGSSIKVEIYANNEWIYTAEKDRNGNPFIAIADQTLNILIELSVDINGNPKVDVRTMVTEWNVAYQWIRF